jgi:inhibitor of cysteine peptidase
MNGTKEPMTESDMAEITIVKGDQGKTFEARPGDIIRIHLAENFAGTGYAWEADPVNDQIIEPQKPRFSGAPGTGIGGGGTRIFPFEAKSPGTVKIQLKLRKGWEPEDAASDRFGVTIRILEE